MRPNGEVAQGRLEFWEVPPARGEVAPGLGSEQQQHRRQRELWPGNNTLPGPVLLGCFKNSYLALDSR